MESVMDIEQWLNETFGPLETSSRVTELDETTEALVPNIDFALPALSGHDVGIFNGDFPPTEVSTGNVQPIIDSGDTLRTRPSSGEMNMVKRRFVSSWINFN